MMVLVEVQLDYHTVCRVAATLENTIEPWRTIAVRSPNRNNIVDA